METFNEEKKLVCVVVCTSEATHNRTYGEEVLYMTEKEWINMGYTNGIIETAAENVAEFDMVYKKWMIYKSGRIKGQSIDRMECTYNRYYADSPLASMRICEINENAVIEFLNGIFANYGSVTLKEYRRIYQIVNNVLEFALDFQEPGARLLNWKTVKNYSYTNHVVTKKKEETSVSDSDIEKLRDFVLSGGYFEKQSACLLLMFNFYVGLRVGELSALEWSDVDIDKRILSVSKTEIKKYERLPDGSRGRLVYEIEDCTKTKAGTRKIPLCDKAVVMIRLLKIHHEKMGYNSKRLLYDGADIIGTRSLEQALRKICKLAEVPLFNTHRIRKTVATKMHYKGLPSRTIADILGHADISTTEKCYILTDTEYFATVSYALNDVFTY